MVLETLIKKTSINKAEDKEEKTQNCDFCGRPVRIEEGFTTPYNGFYCNQTCYNNFIED